MTRLCKKCQQSLVYLKPGPVEILWCEGCKLVHDMTGTLVVQNFDKVETSFDPLKIAKQHVRIPPGTPPLLRSTMEAAIIEGLLQSYMSGLKDGILLSHKNQLANPDK